ncbi:MAG: hypothetical protein A4S17_07300 [Proteobacteria bacterium HN_bin10]|nr:MAG: hypothetical protein A4S17_07300 [Proteobacteria bacterium HN_bin10]
MNWGVNEWVAVLSALLAVVSLALNWLVVRRQTELQYETLRAEMDAEVIAWAHEAIDHISRAAALARGRGVTYAAEELRRLAFESCQGLSSIADRGRLFFPNESPETHGRDKEAAFQGYRPPILDAVVFASTRIGRLETDIAEPDKDAADFLTKCRRLLVSEAQNAIDPRRRGQMLRRLAVGRMDDKTSAYALAAELGEALESLYPGYLLQRRDAAWIANRETIARQRQN